MNRHRDKLHLRLTAVAFVVAIGLPLLLHRAPDPDAQRSTELRLLERCTAAVLAIGDLGPHARIAVVTWTCSSLVDAGRWTDARR
ncbi:MAG: hypothetical protein J0H14_24420 [Alphaproteobacteria bacterium]|nr:hypothetical protein [Alphaproteobacteria bacterium]